MKYRANIAEMITLAKSYASPSYTTLIASVSAWIASVVLIMYPTIGVTTPVFPPKPTPVYQFVLLLVTTCAASVYSAIMGLRLLKEEE